MKINQFLIYSMLTAILLSSCGQRREESKLLISQIGVQSISVPEPSGLDITFDRSGFWTVSDENSTIYRLDNEGNVVEKIIVDGSDLEGITVVDENKIAVVLERDRVVLLLDIEGQELKRKKLPLTGEANSGLEGIAYNSTNKHFYVINEKKPSLLIELNEQLEILTIDTLRFSKDVSDIFCDEVNNHLWILSDESQLLIKCDMNGKPLEKISLSIVQPEGLTIDNKGGRLYIVSDNRESMYVYKLN